MTTNKDLTSISATLFPCLELGDIRRNRRFSQVAQALAEKPGVSLPEVFPNPSHYNACMNLFDAEECNHENILGAHQEAVLNRMEAHAGPILLLHDGTCMDFSGHTSLEDELGPIGNGGGRGWVAHQTIAVDPSSRMVFGLISQILHVRKPAPKKMALAARRARENRESRLWIKGLDAIGPTPENRQWIDVADRGADIFEFLQTLQDRKRRFIVRSSSNRAMGSGPTDEKATELLHESLRSMKAMATWELEVPGRAIKPTRKAILSAVSQKVTLRPPHVRKGEFRLESLELTAVRVWESKPPKGTKALEWILLTSEAADSPESLKKVCDWYSCRMQIEEYHKVQKTGVGIERCQVQSAKKMAAFIALMSVVAVALLNARLAARDPENSAKPAEALIPRAWIIVLATLREKSSEGWTVSDFWVNLAKLGGYFKNPKRHPPGWITLWRGWKTIQPVIGYHLSIQKMA